MDTLEQRLTTDLAAAADAAGLTPPDRAAVAARAAARRRRARRRAGLAVAAVTLVVAGIVAALAGQGDGAGTETGDVSTEPTPEPRPSTTTAPEATTSRPTTTDPTTGGTAPAGDATPPSSSTTATTAAPPPPPAEPVTAGEVAGLAFPFSGGTRSLPTACHGYWDSSGFTPEGNGLAPDANGIEVLGGTITLADVDGDGVDDGLAAFVCETGGTIPPGGLLVVLAADRSVVTDDGTLPARHEADFGDPRTRITGPISVADGVVSAELSSYRQTDPNAGASARAVATYRLADGSLALTGLRPL